MLGRHSMRAVRRDLALLPTNERQLAVEWFAAIEDRWTDVNMPSRLTTAVEMLMLDSAFPMGQLDRNYNVAGSAVNMGYAARLVEDGQFPSPEVPWARELRLMIPPGDTAAVAREASLGADSAVVHALVECVAEACEPESFARMVGFDASVWNAMTSLACYAWHKNMRKNRWGDTRVLTLDAFDQLLRGGYVLRRLDESLGASPRTLAEVEAGD